jgi:HEAT repeat protein
LTTDGRLRELALAALDQIGSDEAVPVLGDILRPRNVFTRDTPQIRVAAARALAAISTPAAKDLLRSVAAAESDSATRAAMSKLVV